MRVRKPDYFDRFSCIAGACSDSCCIGWEIEIDEEKKDFYRRMPGALGRRLEDSIDWEEGHFMLQGKEERCPFLNQEKLCDLITELGEEALCEICREHPRFYDWFDSLTEKGLGLCCEAAGRLILEREEPTGFIMEEEGSEGEAEDCKRERSEEERQEAELLQVLFEARETAFCILQSRSLSIWDRLWIFLDFAEELQEMLELGVLEEITETVFYYRETKGRSASCKEKASCYPGMLKLCHKLEAIDAAWPERLTVLEALTADPAEISRLEEVLMRAEDSREYEYEHLAVYFVYRYFMKCRFDGDVYGKAALVLFCLFLIHLLDLECVQRTGVLTKEDRVQNAKFCSKEIEYSEENLELLAQSF